MRLIAWLKEKGAWNKILDFLKSFLRGTLLLLLAALQDLAVEAAKQVAAQGLPTDDAKRTEFARIMKARALARGYELGNAELNLLRELAVAKLKNT